MWLSQYCNAAALPLSFIVPGAAAQGTDRNAKTIAAGTRVHVTHRGEGRRAGTVVGLPPDTLLVHWDNANEPAALPLARMTNLEVSRGTYRRFLKGTAIGLVVRAGVGAAAGLAARPEDYYLTVPGASVMGCLAGGLVGLIVGAQILERWEEVPLGAARARWARAPTYRCPERGVRRCHLVMRCVRMLADIVELRIRERCFGTSVAEPA